jgi:hypothetical protein
MYRHQNFLVVVLGCVMALTFDLQTFGQTDQRLEIRLQPSGAVQATVTSLPDGSVEVKTTGKIALIHTAMQGKLDSLRDQVLSFNYFAEHATDHVRLTYRTSDSREHPALLLPGVSHSEGQSQYTADLSQFDGWDAASEVVSLGFESESNNLLRLSNVMLRPLSEQERVAAAGKVALRSKDEALRRNLQKYLEKQYPDSVDTASSDAASLKIAGTLRTGGVAFLAEVPLYEDLTELKHFNHLIPVKSQADHHFALTLPRFRRLPGYTYDRIFSKWVLVCRKGSRYTLLSHAHFIDDVAVLNDLPDEVPRSKKGLGGFSVSGPLQDIEQLGITSVTVNIFLDFLRSGPGVNRTSFVYGGKTYYADSEKIKHYDETMRYAAAHKLIVSAILLVPKRSSAQDGTPATDLADPHADPAAIYAMPNVSSAAGLQVYAGMLDFLAQRYSRPDKQFGRIHHWIMHNEVDAGWVWTNAGERSELTFIDTYIKSMRTMYLIARQYNSHARVYISLTHFWDWTEDRHFYLPHHLLDDLVLESHDEGDFDWSIAYHPYPESLFKPRTWEDTKVAFSLDTPLITFKNIEVLDAWTKLPGNYYRGQKPRTVFLSEQGFNSVDYAPGALADQAAGLAYAWKKVENLDSIEALQYHNWIDNRGEGGLRIGLRKFPDDSEDPLGRKPIWFLYQALGTPAENAACQPYEKVVGIADWSTVQHHGPITGTGTSPARTDGHR